MHSVNRAYTVRNGSATGFAHVGDLVVETLLDLDDDAQVISDLELVLRLRKLRAAYYRREDVSLRELVVEVLLGVSTWNTDDAKAGER